METADVQYDRSGLKRYVRPKKKEKKKRRIDVRVLCIKKPLERHAVFKCRYVKFLNTFLNKKQQQQSTYLIIF